ncbi:MAG: GWxTD domain-containing protein [Acidobacteriaceae bacterium]
MFRPRPSAIAAFILPFAVAMALSAGAQQAPPTDPTDHNTSADDSPLPMTLQQSDPTQRKLTDKEKIAQQRALREEEKGAYKTWLNEDVRWIITDEEEKAFKSLTNDEERDNFIENFWLRRNPNPDSPDNEFRDEHYRRIQYANDHFAAGKPGWKTDRGHIYIAYGKPDSIDSHPSGGSYQRPMEEGGGETSTFPFETWHYRYIEGIGDNIDIEFVDTCMCGDYHMTIDRSEKDALLHTPGAGLTQYEEMGQAKKADRFQGGGLERLGNGPESAMNQSKQFDRVAMFAKLQAAPPIKFKDLEMYMSSKKILTGPIFPFEVRTDYVKVTNDTVLVPVTLQIRNRDITFSDKDGVARGTVNILGRVTTLTGRIAQTFEDTVQVDVVSDQLAKTKDNVSVYWKALPLRPGRYRVDVVIKDMNNTDHVGVWARGIEVPKYDDDRLSASSLILADRMERVPSKEIGAGNFVIGNTYIRPRVGATPAAAVTFHRNQSLNFWMQVYNLGIDDKSKQNGATIEYQIQEATTHKTILDTSEFSNKMEHPSSDQLTLEKTLPLGGVQPGNYTVTIKINDGVTKQQIAESAPFVVE